MSAELEVRSWEDQDVTAIVDLLTSSMGTTAVPRSGDYWRWKHSSNPFGRSSCLIARDGDRLLAVRAFMRWQWRQGERVHHAMRAVDTIVSPMARGRGLFTRLTKRLLDEVAADGTTFIFNTPNSISRAGYLKLGWVDVGRISPMIRICRPDALLRARTSPDAAYANGPPGLGSDWPDEQELEELIQGARDESHRFETHRSVGYLHWRYRHVPGVHYRVAAESRNGAGALLIYRLRTTRRMQELRLVELLMSGGSSAERAARALIGHVISTHSPDAVTAVASTRSPERNVYYRCGLLPVPIVGPRFTVRPCQPAAAAAPRMVAWRFSAGDLELF